MGLLWNNHALKGFNLPRPEADDLSESVFEKIVSFLKNSGVGFRLFQPVLCFRYSWGLWIYSCLYLHKQHLWMVIYSGAADAHGFSHHFRMGTNSLAKYCIQAGGTSSGFRVATYTGVNPRFPEGRGSSRAKAAKAKQKHQQCPQDVPCPEPRSFLIFWRAMALLRILFGGLITFCSFCWKHLETIAAWALTCSCPATTKETNCRQGSVWEKLWQNKRQRGQE